MLMSTTPSHSVMSSRVSTTQQSGDRRPRRKAVNYVPVIMAVTLIVCLLIVITVLVLIFSTKSKVKTRNYCDPQLCPVGLRHVACWPAPANCSGFEAFDLRKRDQDNILALHNQCRRDLALRLPASDMRKLIWDEELEYLAYVHASACQTTADECRNTERFEKVGQNINALYESDENKGEENYDQDYPEACYTHAIKSWCLQGRKMSNSMFRNYRSDEKTPHLTLGQDHGEPQYFVLLIFPPKIAKHVLVIGTGHTDIHNFAQLARDSARRLGCAVVRFNGRAGTLKVCLTVCNYDEANEHGKEIVQLGRSCFQTPLHRKCEEGLSD